MPEPKLELRQISKAFHADGLAVQALEDLSLEVTAGEFLTLVGPSGSGKSTILNLIAGLLEPDVGEIWLDGAPCAERAGRFGYMPQRDLLMPWRSIAENVIVSQELSGGDLQMARSRAAELLPLFGLQGFETAYPASLSGGMRQRAALLRTVLTGQEVLLLDEPFGALDALTRSELQSWLMEVWGRLRQTVVFVTHDVEEALYLGDRVVVLSQRPGRVLRTLPVRLPRPRSRAVLTQPEFRAQLAELMEALGLES